MEIERKFLLSSLPVEIKPYSRSIIHSVYISIEPEVRVREKIDCATGLRDYKITVKGNGTLSRFEEETLVTDKFYQGVKNFIDKIPIEKDYYKYFLSDNHTLEVSIVDDEAFIYGEVEFTSEEDAMSFEWPWPDILIKEITNDYDYKMKNYWARTRLGEDKRF
jgi:CYTH domain-containing protein